MAALAFFEHDERSMQRLAFLLPRFKPSAQRGKIGPVPLGQCGIFLDERLRSRRGVGVLRGQRLQFINELGVFRAQQLRLAVFFRKCEKVVRAERRKRLLRGAPLVVIGKILHPLALGAELRLRAFQLGADLRALLPPLFGRLRLADAVRKRALFRFRAIRVPRLARAQCFGAFPERFLGGGKAYGALAFSLFRTRALLMRAQDGCRFVQSIELSRERLHRRKKLGKLRHFGGERLLFAPLFPSDGERFLLFPQRGGARRERRFLRRKAFGLLPLCADALFRDARIPLKFCVGHGEAFFRLVPLCARLFHEPLPVRLEIEETGYEFQAFAARRAHELRELPLRERDTFFKVLLFQSDDAREQRVRIAHAVRKHGISALVRALVHLDVLRGVLAPELPLDAIGAPPALIYDLKGKVDVRLILRIMDEIRHARTGTRDVAVQRKPDAVQNGALPRTRIPEDAEDPEFGQFGKIYFGGFRKGIDPAKFQRNRLHDRSNNSKNACVSSCGGASPYTER